MLRVYHMLREFITQKKFSFNCTNKFNTFENAFREFGNLPNMYILEMILYYV